MDRRGGPSGPPALHDAAARVLGGEWCETRGQRFLSVDRTYAPGHRHGRVAVADSLPPPDGMWPRLPLLAGAPCRGRMLFIDLETTGLAGGAGSYAFLVGCGWFERPSPAASTGQVAGAFRTRQFFLSSFAAERALLEALSEVVASAGAVVTYNGKTFDLPLIETRFLLYRMSTPFAGMPHVDMVHPARRLWKRDEDHAGEGWRSDKEATPPGRIAWRPDGGDGGGCKLSVLEEGLCGHVRDGDVPGFEIPARYFQYVRSGDSRPLDAVLEHNRLDLLSLALITARATRLLDEGAAGAATVREALGLGRLYERAGMTADARACFARAAGIDDGAGDVRPGGMTVAESPAHAEALRAYAVLSRRERRFAAAAAAWRRVLDLRRCPSHIIREATDALAVHHEHRLRDPGAARSFALQSMTLRGSRSRAEALQHRLARLERKLRDRHHGSATLFTFT
jgi:uncharacterized protein